MADHGFRQLLTQAGVWIARPAAFVVVACYAVVWFTFEPESLNWHGVAVLATLFMTLVIQRAEHRDTQAIHAKLDELLKAEKNARTEMREIDKKDPEAIERLRERSSSHS
jgi:low affinity Fe/Cu permease